VNCKNVQDMILTCPSCDTQYFADDATIGDSGRSVKCAACNHSWHVHGDGGGKNGPAIAAAGGAHEVRNDVVRIWPQSAEAYKGLGLEVNRFGLDFNTIEPLRTFDGTTPVLTVTGTVVNISSISQPGANVFISLRDENGIEVGSLTAPMSPWSLAPGAEATFEARLENPPVAAFDLELSFISSDGAKTPGQGGGSVEAAKGTTE